MFRRDAIRRTQPSCYAKWARRLHVCAGPGGEFPARLLVPLKRCSHFGKREVKNVMQQKSCSFKRRQLIKRQEQREREILSQFRLTIGSQGCRFEDWFG